MPRQGSRMAIAVRPCQPLRRHDVRKFGRGFVCLTDGLLLSPVSWTPREKYECMCVRRYVPGRAKKQPSRVPLSISLSPFSPSELAASSSRSRRYPRTCLPSHCSCCLSRTDRSTASSRTDRTCMYVGRYLPPARWWPPSSHTHTGDERHAPQDKN